MEKWNKWIPLENLQPKYNVDSILDSFDGLKIILSDTKDSSKKVIFNFDGLIDSYRSSDEGFSLRKLNELEKFYGNDFYKNWTFFTVENSEYIKWLSNESYGVYDSIPKQHYSFLASNVVIDIISLEEPKVNYYE